MPPNTKKSKGKSAQNNNNNNGRNAKVAHGKNKKQDESDEFERVLAEITKATAAIGMKRAKQMEHEKVRKEREERQKEKNEKSKGIEEEFDMMLRRKQKHQHLQQILQQFMTAQRPFLDAPNTEFHSETETRNPNFDVAVGAMQGWRLNMEDEHVVDVVFPDGASDSKEGLFCVFDGHSGKGCATKCRELIPKMARTYATRTADGTSTVDFEKVYMEADSVLEKGLPDESGCTAVTVHVTPAFITCASVGDSRAVLCRNGAAFPLAYDHKPENEQEKARIEAAGGSVSENRVNGQLAMSRAMGDFTYKAQKSRSPTEQEVIAMPDVIRLQRESGDAWVVLACDGIFDVLSNDELVEHVLSKKHEGKSNKQICEEICRECLAPPAENGGLFAHAEGTDNMTIMIVDLK
ncbi:putative protein phosphatase 2C [Trypanosoma grayi]|uniref:putative protein phosphatase 2C n=1 Tax=Trypanosoma grayi TaxID=71804 RepID=UPI0004F42F3F|nr:putative protein phosphatase 2C [Trypanosoma grayi]KEG09579.1 putative protein phosphatase 2C [Trypanosoma grayi]